LIGCCWWSNNQYLQIMDYRVV